jgi:hypothetical protein
LLEGDENKTVKITKSNKIITDVEFTDIGNILDINNIRKLEKIKNNCYKFNSCFLKIFRLEFNTIFNEFFEFIKNNIHPNLLINVYDKTSLKKINKEIKFHVENEKYDIIIYYQV